MAIEIQGKLFLIPIVDVEVNWTSKKPILLEGGDKKDNF